MTLFQDKTNQANGLTRDLQGRLVACEHETRRVIRQEHDGSITVIANSFQGERLNSPNDVVVNSDSAIYFTDPMGFTPAHDQWDMTYAGVYRVSAKTPAYAVPDSAPACPRSSVVGEQS